MDGNNQDMGAMNYNQAAIDEYFRSLPPGYRFNPTDQELIMYYLNPKILNQPLPLNRIHNLNIYKYHPKQLSEKFHKIREDGWYFFSTRDRKYQNGTRPNRLTDGGCWKATGSGEKINAEGGELIGQKRVLQYKTGTHPHYIKTEWKMHEYTVEEEEEDIPIPKRKKGEGDMKLDVVLCKIYINTRDNGNTNNNGAITSENCDQGIMITDTAGPSHDRGISVLKQEASRVQPLDSSVICGMQPYVQINTDEGFNHLDHISNSSTIPENCFYSSAAMSNVVYDSTNYTHYGGTSMTNGASGSVYQLAGSSFTQFHHQNSSNYSMYFGQMPSSSTSYISKHSLALPYPSESLTQSESENHEMPRLHGSTTSVSLPAHVREYEYSMLVNKDEADADGLQYLNIPDEVHEDDSKLDKLHEDDHKTY